VAINSIARRTSKVKGKYKYNKVKEAILLIIRRRRSDICDNICSNCSKVCGEVCGKVCSKVYNKVYNKVWAILQNSKKYSYFLFKYSLESL
jgi:hypothetical protein